MKFRLWGTEVRLSFALLPFLCACIMLGETDALLCAGAALLLHECAHGIAIRNLGNRVTRLNVYPFGAVMHLEPMTARPGGAWIAAIAGPLGSFLAACVTRLCVGFFPHAEWLNRFYATNLAIALLNLLPAFPLDGGRIAQQLLLRTVSERTANRMLLAFTGTIAAGLIGCFCRLLHRGIFAWTVPMLTVFLIGAAIRESRQSAMGPVRHVLDRQAALQRGQSMNAAIVAVSPSVTIGEALGLIRPTRYTILHVSSGRTFYSIEEATLLELAAKFDRQTPLKDII